MKIGALGSVVFSVSDSTIKTINNYNHTSKGNYSVHQIHNGIGKTEYTGADPDNMTFDVLLSQNLGVNVNNDFNQLCAYSRNGNVLNFILGDLIYQKVIISSVKAKAEAYAQNGDIISMSVSVSLQEYV